MERKYPISVLYHYIINIVLFLGQMNLLNKITWHGNLHDCNNKHRNKTIFILFPNSIILSETLNVNMVTEYKLQKLEDNADKSEIIFSPP